MSYRWKAHQRVPARPKSACTSSAIREPDQIGRREQFLRDHPGSRIYPLELGGAIQAEVPDGKTGERLIRSRYTLKELLDVLDEALPVGR